MIITKLSQLPNLTGVKALATDCETVDPNLKALGAGDIRGDGRVVGVALAVPSGESWYLPLGHDDLRQNLPRAGAVAWLKAVHGQPDTTYHGAQLQYDLGWYEATGCPVKGELRDVLHAGRLLDMDGKYPSLDELLTQHLQTRKTGDSLWQWLAERHGGEPTRGAQITRLSSASARLVGEYAQGDVVHLFKLLEKLKPRLEARHAWDWFLVEEELLPICHAMRARGVRVDVRGAEQLQATWGKRYDAKLQVFGREVYGSLWKKLGGAEKREHLEAVKPTSALAIAAVYARRGVKLPTTATGLPSLTKAWLTAQDDPLSRLIKELRSLSKLGGTFVDGYVLGHQVRGRLHPTLKQLWPRTLRLSSEHPSEQNIPKRDEELSPLIRGLFLPEEGEEWLRTDYSQQEYRLLVHNAHGPGADEARAKYNADPGMDFHAFVQGLFKTVAKRDMKRQPMKDANFAKTYRAGVPRFTSMLGLTADEGKELYELYDRVLPFVTATARKAQELAEREREGEHYVNLLLKGMRLYFDKFEINDWDAKNAARDETDPEIKGRMEKALSTPYSSEAEARQGAILVFGEGKRWRVRRWGTYKALNTVIQPSAAQQMKWAMVSLKRAGVYDELGVPLVSVHDELGLSLGKGKRRRAAAREAVEILTHCADAELRVPMRVGVETGPDWGHLTGATL